MRRAALVVLLAATRAAGHTVPFEFVAPQGAGTRSMNGIATIEWSASDPQDIASFSMWAARGSTSPFGSAPRDVPIIANDRPVSASPQVFDWDTRAVAPGCYQPYAVVSDPTEGLSVRLAPGVIAVGPTDGGDQPVVAWVDQSGAQRAPPDGRFVLRFTVLDPDDAPKVTVRYLTSTLDDGGTLAENLPLAFGGGAGSYTVDTAGLLPANAWYLQLEATTPGSTCTVWWQGVLLPPFPVADAGTPDAGGDAGASDAGSDGGTEPPQRPRGCGCGSPDGLFALLALTAARRYSLVMRPPSG